MTSQEANQRGCPLAWTAADTSCEGHYCMWWRGDIEDGNCIAVDIAAHLCKVRYPRECISAGEGTE